MKTLSLNDTWTCNGTPVTLPHDAQISEQRSANVSNCGHGYFPGGIYTYEKTFAPPAEWADKTVLVETVVLLSNRNSSQKNHIKVNVDMDDYRKIKEAE